jgi:hypothetical protein
MKSRPAALLVGLFLFVCGAIVPAAAAKTAGNCLECHSQRFSFNGAADFYAAAGIENRLVYQARLNPCPGVKTLSEETFYTESRLVQLDRMASAAAGEGTAAAAWRRKTGEAAESFGRMKAEAGHSASAFANDAAILRGGLQKVYDQAFEARAESGRRRLIGISAMILILAALLAGVGYRKLGGFGKKALVAALLCGSFSLSACTQEARETAPKSSAQERLDQARAVAGKLTARIEERVSAAILLAGAAGDWSRLDDGGGEKAFQLAWRMALKGREEGALTAPLRKIAAEWPNPAEAIRSRVNFDAVLDLRDDLRALEGRTWALRAVAEEWHRVSPKKGRESLEFATREALAIQNADVRDIELKALAEAWAGIDEAKALETAGAIRDPFLKSVSLGMIAPLLKDKETAGAAVSEAWGIMETIPVAPLKIQSFAKVSAAAAVALPQRKGEWAEKARGKAKELKDPLLQGFAFQELVSAWARKNWEQAERFAKEIPAEQAEARAFALIQVGAGEGIPPERAAAVLRGAVEESGRIEDGFQSQKATSVALLRLAAQQPGEAKRILSRLTDPLLRSEVEIRLIEALAEKDQDEALKASGHIPGEFQRSRAVLGVLNRKLPRDIGTANALFQEAKKAAGAIPEPYTRTLLLVDLGRSWGRIDKAKGAAAYEEALNSSKEISSPSLRAEALELLASAWKDSDKAKAQAVLAAVDSAVLRARETAGEAKLWAKTDIGRARQAAESIPGGFAVEKAQAFKELGSAVKKLQPALALEYFEKAWVLAVTIPEGGSKEKILTQILGETAPLNADKALTLVREVPDREMKDRLLREAGSSLIKEESAASLSGAVKIAGEISESSLRAVVYQKAADRLAKGPAKGNGTEPALLDALSQWGAARETAKREESEAKPIFEKAFAQIGKIADGRNRAFLLAALVGDWAQAEEGMALKAAETIPPESAEALSYGLLQAGVQYRKWSRKEAESVFEKALRAAERISDPSLKGQRMREIAREWQAVNREKGKEVLQKAGEAPASSYGRAKSVLDWAKLFYKESIEKDLKILEKTMQSAQESKSPRLLTQASLAWFWVDSGKAQEIAGQIEPKESRVKALCSLAIQMAKTDPGLAASLLEKAVREAAAIEGLAEKINALRGVAADWAAVNPNQAKAAYQMILQTAEKADLTNPEISNR